ncbi:MAG: hypothetical protein QOE09_1308 [Ilumatobacteraceae bacterium]
MNTVDETVEAATSSSRHVHIVDATKGPLIGDGRLHRIMPFAITAILSTIVALPSTSWAHPGFAIAGAIVIAAMIVSSLTFPWSRVPRAAQLTLPFLFLAVTLLLASASGKGIGSPFVTMAVLPLMWLAIYESRRAVLLAALVAGAVLWLGPTGDLPPSGQGIVSSVVFVICGAGMGITLHGLVSDARKLALALRDQKHALEDAAAMLDSLPERVNRYRLPDLAITYCNEAWAAQYNVEPTRAIGRPLDEFLSDDELAGLHSQLAILGPDNPILVDSVARAVPNGEPQWLEWVDRYLTGPEGAEVLSIARDVSERHDAEVRLAESEARFRDLADKSADVVWRFALEPSPHFEYVSPSVENILGYPPSYFLEDFSRMLDVLDDGGRTAVVRALQDDRILERFDFHFRHADGSTIVGETRTTLVHGGIQGVSRDVTELRQLQANMADLALRDPLTGLANRRLFDELLDAAVARTERNGAPLAVAFLDLDDFKSVNDKHGHDVGDLVLRETARRLLTIVRGADSVARIGGDEFVIVYEPDDTTSHNLVQRMDRALSAPISIAPTTWVRCSPSIGIAEAQTVGYNGTALLAAADDAMYIVKRTRQAVRETEDARDRMTVGL